MDIYYKIFTSFLAVITLTLILKMFKNNSNFDDKYIIPIIATVTVKYLLGDWDIGYTWTTSDIFYWVSLLGISSFISNININ